MTSKMSMYFLVMLLFFVSTSFQCEKEEMRDSNEARWIVYNHTGQKITLDVNFNDYDRPSTQALESQHAVYVAEKISSGPDKAIITFDWLYMNASVDYELKVSVDGTVRKVWKLSEANNGGKQFFNEQSWRLSGSSSAPYNQTSLWIFEITEEDLNNLD